MNNEIIEPVPSDIGERVQRMISEMEGAFSEIQQARTNFQIRHFVVGQHDTTQQQYFQCVLELQIKYDNIRRAVLQKQIIEIDIGELEAKGTEKARLKAGLKRIDLEEQDRAMLGAWREFQCLYSIWQSYPTKFTRAELDEAQPEYWRLRLTRQAEQDKNSLGRVQIGNSESLQQIAECSVPFVERKYLETNNCKILVVVPTRTKAEKLPCLDGLILPSGIQFKYLNVFEMNVADAYNHAVNQLFEDDADFMLTVEDDTFPPANAVVELMKLHDEHGPKVVVGAWYRKRQSVREGTPIVLHNGRRQALADDGQVHEVYTIPMGCTLFPAEVFRDVDSPYFATTGCLTQDSFFSQKARDAGWKLLVDTSIRCKHVDVKTGMEYE